MTQYDKEKSESLIVACEAGSLKWVKELIAAGADPRYLGDVAATTAMTTGHFELTKYLIENYGADPQAKQGEGFAAACGLGDTELVDYLLRAGCNANPDNGRPLENAADSGSTEVVGLLLNHGADPSVNDSYAFYLACAGGFIDVAKMLLVGGADIHCRDDDSFKVAVEDGDRRVVGFLYHLAPKYYEQLIDREIDLGSHDWLSAMLNKRTLSGGDSSLGRKPGLTKI